MEAQFTDLQCELRGNIVFMYIGKEFVDIKDENRKEIIYTLRISELSLVSCNGNNVILNFGEEYITVHCELSKLQAYLGTVLLSSRQIQEPSRKQTLAGTHKKEKVQPTDQNEIIKTEVSPNLKNSPVPATAQHRGENLNNSHKGDIMMTEDLISSTSSSPRDPSSSTSRIPRISGQMPSFQSCPWIRASHDDDPSDTPNRKSRPKTTREERSSKAKKPMSDEKTDANSPLQSGLSSPIKRHSKAAPSSEEMITSFNYKSVKLKARENDSIEIGSPRKEENNYTKARNSSPAGISKSPSNQHEMLRKQPKQARLSKYYAKREREEIINLIIHMQAENTAENEKLILAALEKHTKLRGDINELTECDQTILYLACALGNVCIVEYLLLLDGIQLVGIQDKVTGSTPLHAASCSGSTEIVAILLLRGAVPELSTENLSPVEELAKSGLDKEKKKKMEELWRVYYKFGKKGFKKFLTPFLPEGKKISDYKIPERQATLEDILIGLTGSDESQRIVWAGPTGETLTVDVRDLLLTYRLYCTSEELANLLKRLYETSNHSSEYLIQKRILNILKHWINMFYNFVDEENLYTKIEGLLQQLVQSPHQEISKVADKVNVILQSKHHVPLSDTVILLDPLQRQPEISILSFYPLVIVQHLNAIDVSLWRKVRPSDGWNTDKIDCLLNWSFHFQRWVVSEILRGETISQRIEITNRFLDIAEELWCQSFCNLNSLLSILDSLNIFFKTVIFKGIAEDKRNKFEALLKLFEKNFTYCSAQIKSRVQECTLFIPPVAVYNYHGLRWKEKRKPSRTKLNKIVVVLNQMKNAVPYMAAILMLHENAAKLQTATQQKIIDHLASKPLPAEVEADLIKELKSPEYIIEEWYKALERSDIPAVNILLKHNPQLVRNSDHSGRTALHYAADHNFEAMLRVLLLFDTTFPFCVTVEDKFKESPLHVASKNGFNNILSLLLSYHEICLIKDLSQSSSTNVKSREDIAERRNQHRIAQRYMHGETVFVWDTWVTGGSKALEALHYAVITQDIISQAKNKTISTTLEKKDIPLLDWAPFSRKIVTSDTVLGDAYSKLVSTEGEYLHDLVLMLRQIKPLVQNNPHTHPFETEILFEGIDTLIVLHKEFYEELLNLTEQDIECISVLFSQKAEIFKTFYSLYGKNYNRRLQILLKLKQSTKSNNKFCVNIAGVSIPIDSFLIKPIQRISQYPLLLNQMCNGINNLDIRESLQITQLKLTEVSVIINDVIERAQADKIMNNLSAKIIHPYRHIITCGKLSMLKKKQLRFILFSDRLMGFSKGKEILAINKLEWKVEEDFYIQRIISVTTDEEDESVFKIHLFSEDEVWFKANSVEEMQKWVQKINRVKEQWLIEHGPVELAKQLASGLTQEQISKFWRVNDKKDAKAWITLGDLYRKSCKYQDAIECYSNAIENDKNAQYLALYKQAKAYSKIPKKEQEIECLKSALNIINYVPHVDMKVVVNVIQLLQKHNIPT